ncbi:MAG TPA: response regulator, partial [Gemmataceae bacterium]|nr:response regulator [Gemmataceae bacterium]
MVLVIGSDLGVAGQQERRLRRAGYDVVTAGTAAAGMREVRRGNVELIVLDYRLPELNGLEVYDRLKRAGQDLPVILVTDSGDAATILQALRAGVRDFVTKTAGYLDYLPEAVGRVLKQVRLEQQLAVSEARLAGVIHSAMDAIVTADTERHITLFNAAAERTFRCPAAEALGRPLDAFIPAKLNGGA